jgi:hypothetical protein
MSRIVRLTESDLTRLVKRVIKENEKSQSCPVVVNKLLNKLENSLSPEELELITSEYERLGNSGFKRKVVSTLQDETITENKRDAKLEKTINKIAQIVAFASVGFLGGTAIILPCLEGIVDLSHAPEWAVQAFGGALVASIPLALISFVTLALTTEDK